MKLSIVITALNDTEELLLTLKSIRETAGDRPEVVVVDDASANAVTFVTHRDHLFNAHVITNKFRCGVGPSRHIGALHAQGEYILIIDSHMRFTPGWYENAMRRVEARPHTLHCATMLALDSRHMDIVHPRQEYFGGTLNLYGPDRQNPKTIQVLEVVWANGPQQDDAEIGAPLGASYTMPRQEFLRLAPLQFLRGWGSDELFLSLKFWLSGGDVRLMRNVRIGHKYTDAKDKKFRVPLGQPTYNKLFAAHTLFPEDLSLLFERRLRESVTNDEWNAAFQLMRENWPLFAAEKARNERLFTRDVRWLAEKFGIPLPS